MNWTTYYISGKKKFQKEIQRALTSSGLVFVHGYLEEQSDANTTDMYWIDAGTSLREFKRAIGADLIWKYRLRFFTDAEDFAETQSSRTRKETSLQQALSEEPFLF